MTDTQGTPDDLIAAVDLGSNSFHMVIAQEFQGEIRTIEKRGQKVQLGAGLDANGILSEEAQQRGIDCLREFGQRLQGMDGGRVSVLATNALRAARNRSVLKGMRWMHRLLTQPTASTYHGGCRGAE